jgi:hypothetical protein
MVKLLNNAAAAVEHLCPPTTTKPLEPLAA